MQKSRGFTLIELLVVIAIIGVLASVVLASLNSARGRANDAKIRQDMHQIRNALQLYYNQTGSMPPNPNPCCGSPASTALQPLVSAGFLSSIPTSPNPSEPYNYYDYGANNTVGALVVSVFSAATAASTGYAGSCRPWGAGQNWCDVTDNRYYCICNPY